jgi:hypothetical protein
MKLADPICEHILSYRLKQSPATERLTASLVKDFKFVDQRMFFARQVMLVCADKKPLHVRIAGAKPLIGNMLTVENIVNPNNLQIASDEGVLQSEIDADILYVPEGEIVITADRSFQPLQHLDSAKKEILARLPSKDPDRVILDDCIFLQTGTVCIQGQSIFVILGVENAALGRD